MQNFYITTPLYYVNDEPHIGHAYTTILADVIARHHKIMGKKIYFLTGTDEHGQKVQEAAEKRNVTPFDHVNEYVVRYKNIWEKLHINYDDFIRTTENRHTNRVKEILTNLYKKGDIYLDEYKGLYSVSEERFITEKEADEGDFRQIKKINEKNYFFKMSKYQSKLIKHIRSNSDFILPEKKANEVLGFLKKPLNDLCISRPKSRLKWGIEIPFDSEYVTYVWFDALLNYITAIGYGYNDEKFNKWWPANYHLIGKDILITHSVYWITMLMAMGVELPKSIFAHGWWLIEETKMSKSLGNVIFPLDLADEYGADALRYFLMRDMVLGMDANFSFDSFIKRYNSDLANDYGNLVNRVSMLIKKLYNNKIPRTTKYDDLDLEIISFAKSIPEVVYKCFNNLKIHEAIEHILSMIRKVNQFLEKREPWKLLKLNNESNEIAGNTLYISIEILRIGSQLLYPIMPHKTKEILFILGAKEIPINVVEFGALKAGTKLGEGSSPFPRIK